MKNNIINKRLSVSVLLYFISFCFACTSVYFLSYHAQAIAIVKHVSLPIVADIPILQRRLASVTEQIEMSQLHAASRFGSQEEKVDVLIFPEEPDFDRLIALFDLLREYFDYKGVLHNFSAITIGDPDTNIDGVSAYPILFKFSATEEGMASFLSIIRLAGILTVGDALSADERALLVYRTEEENPAGIVAMEQFFATDLLRYVTDPDSYRQQLLRSFSSPEFLSAFQSVLQSSILREASIVLGDKLGFLFTEHDLWPFPMLSLEKIAIKKGNSPGWHSVDVRLLLYTQNQ